MASLSVRFFLLLVLLGTSASFVHAAPPLQVNVSSNEISTRERLTMTVTFRSSSRRYPSFRLPRNWRFRLLRKRRTRKREVIYGAAGSTSFRYVWSYKLIWKPRRTGTFRFRPARVRQGRQRYQTAPISILVRKPSAKIKAVSSELPLRIQPTGTTFLVPVVNPKRAVVGQQVTLSYYLFTRYTETISRAQPPPLIHFEVTPLHSIQLIQFRKKRRIQGRIYNYGLALRYALFPRKAGKLRIAPMSLWIQRDSGQGLQQQRIQSPTVWVEVAQPPQNDGERPTWVGRFKATSLPQNLKLASFSPAPWKVCLEGVGNLIQGQFPKPELPKELKVLYRRKSFQRTKHPTLLKGKVCETYFLKASKAGTYNIPPLSILTFDPWQNENINLETKSLRLQVSGVSKPGQLSKPKRPSSSAQPSNKNLGGGGAQQPPGSNWLGLGVGGGVAFLFFLGVILWRRKPNSFEVLVDESTTADQQSTFQELSNWVNTIQQQPSVQHLKEFESRLQLYLESVSSTPLVGLSMDEQLQSLEMAGFNNDVRARIKTIWNQSQSLRFFPVKNGQIPSEWLDNVSQLLRELARNHG